LTAEIAEKGLEDAEKKWGVVNCLGLLLIVGYSLLFLIAYYGCCRIAVLEALFGADFHALGTFFSLAFGKGAAYTRRAI
jgi:hypothetical protein